MSRSALFSLSHPFLSLLSLNPVRKQATRLLQASTVALMVALSLPNPARAADDREVVTKVKAVYPELAKRMKIAGTVLLHATVDANGKVKGVTTVMGEGMLVEAAKEAVLRWKYAPAETQTVEDVEIGFPE